MKSQKTPKSGRSYGSSHEMWQSPVTASQTYPEKAEIISTRMPLFRDC